MSYLICFKPIIKSLSTIQNLQLINNLRIPTWKMHPKIKHQRLRKV